jgi:8-oxo-dGTP pyrophosphatase MutT (NUDIX family)
MRRCTYKEDEIAMKRRFWGLRASGILLQREFDRKVCLFHRYGTMNSGTWGINGGKIDQGEDAKKSAIRETREEACGGGPMPKGKFTGRTFVFKMVLGPEDYISGDDGESPDENRYAKEGENFVYTTFHYLVEDDEWEPELNWEHDNWSWFDLDKIPQNTVALKDSNGDSIKPVAIMLKNLPVKQMKDSSFKAELMKESFRDFCESK